MGELAPDTFRSLLEVVFLGPSEGFSEPIAAWGFQGTIFMSR